MKHILMRFAGTGIYLHNGMKFKKKFLTECLLIAAAGLISSLPLIFAGIDGTVYQDLLFHLSRIEGIKEGVLSGQFPVMMESVWMEGKGYPVSIFYGDILLYIPALLRIVGVPVVLTYKIFVLLINLLTAFSACFCFKRIFKYDISAYLGMFLYVLASYRLMDIFVRAAVGEYAAFIFFPVIALGAKKILFEDTGSRDYYKNSLILTLGMTGLIETHVLSTVMTVFLLALTFILFAKATFRKKTLLCILKAVGESVIVNLYFFVPFIDYYINEPVYAGKGGDHTQALQIRSAGAYIRQFFDFFGHIFGRNVEDINMRMQLTVGLALTLALFACLVLFLVKYRNYKIFVLGAMSFLCLLMSTDMFPWNSLEGYTHLFKVLSKVQFPWRYLAASIAFITLLTGAMADRVLDDHEKISETLVKIASFILVIVSVFTTAVFSVRYKADYFMVDFKTYDEVDSGYMGACEYLKEGTELTVTEYVPENTQLEAYELRSVKDSKVTVYVANPGDASFVEIPKLNYKGYRAFDEDKNPLSIENGYLNLINVVVPKGYEGNITVKFVQPLSWRISQLISLAGIILIIVYIRKRKPGV